MLILGTSVNGGINSPEALAVRDSWPMVPERGLVTIDVVDAAQWAAMTPEQFMSYYAIIIGDTGCTSGTAAFQVAIDTKDKWSQVIDGDVVIVGTNPSSGSKPQLMRNGIEHIIQNSEQWRTGLYVSLGCAYQDAPADTPVPLLSWLGDFKVAGSASSCAATAGHMFEMRPAYTSHFVDDAYLGNGGCAARSVFTSYPFKNFVVAAIGVNTPSSQEYFDYTENPGAETPYFGTPYILVRGAMSLGSGCGLSEYIPSGEECDLGDGLNGTPSGAGMPPSETCSYSCRLNWCGDGEVDEISGEECDNGSSNGRTSDANGTLISGMCSKSCKLVVLPNPPVARCTNVTVSAPANACGAPANIDDGSSDPDGDLVGCTQSPAGPYNMGNTTVTLTCRDQAGLTAACTGVVTVRDVTPPTVTLGTPNRTVQCNRTASYSDLSDITASDLCSNPVTMLTRTGSVNLGALGTYLLTYPARDTAGNTGSATRTVNVIDTVVPVINLNTPTTMAVECGSTFTDPGYNAIDVCAGNLTGSVARAGTVNPAAVGQYLLRYDLRDPSGNAASQRIRTVNVADTLRPNVTILGPLSQTVECNDPAYQDPGATAADQCAGMLAAIPVTPPNVGAPGSYAVTYRATDPSGNVGTSATGRLVTVADTLPPMLALRGANPQTLECGTPWADPGATASDQCAGSLTVVTSGSVNGLVPGNYTRNYSATDPSGNNATANRAVTIHDSLAPQLQVLPGPSIIECNGSPYVDPGATASDLCAGDLTQSIVVSSDLDQSRSGQYTVTYRVADASGNVGTAVRQLTVGRCPICVDIRLNDYNLFLLEDYNGGHDVLGKVAAGGNITLSDFSVGHELPDSDLSNTLVAGGNLSLNRGSVWGDAHYGGSYSTNPSVTYPRGSAAQGQPIDFAARFAQLRNQSTQLAALPINGTTWREVWGGVMMLGTSSNVNVFDVNASAFNGAVLWSIDAPAGSFVVVNIHGASANFGGFGIQFNGGIDQHGVLFNFVDATNITAQGFGFWGTVLAPYAHVNFTNGSWDGGMYAKSLTGNAEGHLNPLNNRDFCL